MLLHHAGGYRTNTRLCSWKVALVGIWLWPCSNVHRVVTAVNVASASPSSISAEAEVDDGGHVNVNVDQQDEYSSSSSGVLGYEFGLTEIPTSSFTSQQQTQNNLSKPWSILKELFPNNTLLSISDIWESHPVYLPGSIHSAGQNTKLSTLVPPESESSTSSTTRFANLFQIDDSLAVLKNDPTLIHGQDYIILKYMMKDGEEWNGQLPYPSIPLQDIPMLIHPTRGFSLVINDLQKRWPSIKNFARSLESEVASSNSVSCNLYLTPPGQSRAFESHFDWMDVLVLQIAGDKDWTVWTTPLIQHALPDEKRKPTMAEIQSSKQYQENVRLSPGDALYIPRGHLHNATTPLDSQELSMHLTFGIEYLFETTVESLLHHALALFVASNHKDAHESIVLPAGMCSTTNKDDTAEPSLQRLTYEVALHYSISEIVRRTNCGGFGEHHEHPRDPYKEDICALRKSVLIAKHSQMEQIHGKSNQDIHQMYIGGLKALPSQVSLRRVLTFMTSRQPHDGNNTEKSLGAVRYRYPGMEDPPPYFSSCPSTEAHYYQELNSVQDTFEQFATRFMEFGMDMYEDAKEKLELEMTTSRLDRWRKEDEILFQVFGSL